ncbi:MAG: chain length-determining protein [Rhodoferax sp.]|nr:chain length-determining protein [Rhodoferax sp.]
MQEILAQITGIARGMWRFRWAGVLVAWLVAAVATVVVFRIPNQYEASARIYVDTQSILKPLMAGLAVQPNIEQQIGMLSRTLISRPNLEKLVRMADLDLGAQSKTQQDKLFDDLTKDIRINSTTRDNLFTLNYKNSDQDKAKRVIQSLVSIFVESSLGASRKDTDSARVFLDEQIRNFEAKLEEAEARLKEFRLRNLDMQSPDGQDAAARMAGLSRQLEDARLQLREAERARDSAKTQLAAEKSQSGNIVTQSLLQESAIQVSTPELDGRIEAQKRNLDALLQRFTDQHPDVVNTKRLIGDLEAQKSKEMAAQRKKLLATAGTTGPVAQAQSLVSQELNRMLAASEVQVAALQARVAEYSARLEAARAAVRTAPQLEAEAAQLNRDYDITKKNYDNLVARRQAAMMSGDLESAAGVADFRLIDPPRVSPKPVSPNRLMLLPLVLVAAIAGGLFTAFVASQLRPAFYDVTDLRQKTGLPLLGVVSVVLGDAERRRERMDRLRFFGATGSLVLLFGAGLAVMAVMAGR